MLIVFIVLCVSGENGMWKTLDSFVGSFDRWFDLIERDEELFVGRFEVVLVGGYRREDDEVFAVDVALARSVGLDEKRFLQETVARRGSAIEHIE